MTSAEDDKHKPGGPKGDPLDLQVSVKFLNLTDLDTVKQAFSAEVEITVVTRVPRESISDEFFKKGGPKIFIRNAIQFERVNDKEDPNGYELKGGRVCWVLRCRGVFSQALNLDAFPIDIQALGVEVQSERCPLVRGDPENSKRLVRLFIDSTASTDAPDFPPVVVTENSITLANSYMNLLGCIACVSTTDRDASKRQNVYSYVRACIVLQRKHHYFVQNLIAPSYVSTLLAMTSFFLPTDELGDRLALTFTMLLTAAAYKIAAADQIPPVSEVTLMDYQIHICTGFAFLVASQNVLASRLGAVFNFYSGLFILIAFTVFFCISCYLWWTRCERNNEALPWNDRVHASWDEKCVSYPSTTGNRTPLMPHGTEGNEQLEHTWKRIQRGKGNKEKHESHSARNSFQV